MMKLTTICFVTLAVAATSCVVAPAHAEEPITDAITRAMFRHSGDTYRNTGIDRQATTLFGLSYSDLEAVNDARAVSNIYQDLIRQRGGTPVRTEDLPNPFNTSILTNPQRFSPRY